MAGILVYALHYEGAFNKNSLGAVTEASKLARELGTEAHAVVVGEGVPDDLASQLVAERPILGDSSISESRYKGKGIIIGRLNAFEMQQVDGGSATVEDVQVEL